MNRSVLEQLNERIASLRREKADIDARLSELEKFQTEMGVHIPGHVLIHQQCPDVAREIRPRRPRPRRYKERREARQRDKAILALFRDSGIVGTGAMQDAVAELDQYRKGDHRKYKQETRDAIERLLERPVGGIRRVARGEYQLDSPAEPDIAELYQ